MRQPSCNLQPILSLSLPLLFLLVLVPLVLLVLLLSILQLIIVEQCHRAPIESYNTSISSFAIHIAPLRPTDEIDSFRLNIRLTPDLLFYPFFCCCCGYIYLAFLPG